MGLDLDLHLWFKSSTCSTRLAFSVSLSLSSGMVIHAQDPGVQEGGILEQAHVGSDG